MVGITRQYEMSMVRPNQNRISDQPPAMIPPVKLGLLALGLAGWPLELEDDTAGLEC